jgi:hypothetical protein
MIAYCGCLFLDVLSLRERRDARRGKEKRGRPDELGKTAVRNNKKYERSQYVIENTGKHVQNELKRTQNERQLSAEMRALRVEFELSNDSQPDGITVTSSRLDKLGTSIGADLTSGRVAASYPRIVAF